MISFRNLFKQFKLPKLNDQQVQELARVFLDIGKAILLGSIGAFFIPELTNQTVSLITLLVGLLASLTLIFVDITLLREKQS